MISIPRIAPTTSARDRRYSLDVFRIDVMRIQDVCSIEIWRFVPRPLRASCARVSSEKDIIWAWRLWRELSVYHARTLGRRNRIARCGVQWCDKSTTEFSHARKCMCFPSEILEHEAEALFSLGSIGNEAPRPDGFIAPSSA